MPEKKKFSLKFSRAKGTFIKPKKKWNKESQRYNLHKRSRASLKAGIDLRAAVSLPPDEKLDDWLSVHVVDFYNRINLIYGTLSEFCTDETCPVMSGGPKYEYLWADDDKYKKPTVLSAPMYIALLMDWVDKQVNDEDVFPPNADIPFPKNFENTVKNLFKRLFRVFVHVYMHHFDKVTELGLEAHVNQCYKHFYHFVMEFQLVEKKELEPLKEMSSNMCR